VVAKERKEQTEMKHMQDMARVATGLGVVIKESVDNLRSVATCLKSSTVETLVSLATFVLDIARVTRDRTYEYERHAQAQQRQQDLFRNQKRETLSIAQKKESRQERSPMPQSKELFAPRNRKACRKEFRTSNVSFGKASSLFDRVGLPSVAEEVFRDKDASEDGRKSTGGNLFLYS
jgi:hypothetical protein